MAAAPPFRWGSAPWRSLSWYRLSELQLSLLLSSWWELSRNLSKSARMKEEVSRWMDEYLLTIQILDVNCFELINIYRRFNFTMAQMHHTHTYIYIHTRTHASCPCNICCDHTKVLQSKHSILFYSISTGRQCRTCMLVSVRVHVPSVLLHRLQRNMGDHRKSVMSPQDVDQRLQCG